MDVDGMLARMTPAQFDEWVLDHKDEPWEITLRHFSVAVALIVNALRTGPVSELKERDVLPIDFLLPKTEDESGRNGQGSLAAMRGMIGV